MPPKPATSFQSKTFPRIHKWRMTVGKGRNFESSSRGHQGSSRNLPFDSYVCSVQVCGLAGVWNFRFGDIPQAQVFFSRAPNIPWRGRSHLRRAWTLWAPKIQLSGAVARGLEGNDDTGDAPCGCRANDVSINVDSETKLSTKIKRTVQIHHREKERKKVTTTKTTQKFAAKTF